jgi:hypothetical protein
MLEADVIISKSPSALLAIEPRPLPQASKFPKYELARLQITDNTYHYMSPLSTPNQALSIVHSQPTAEAYIQ